MARLDTETGGGGGMLRRMADLESAVKHLDDTVQEQQKSLTRLEPLAVEVKSLRKAAYWVAGIIVASSIGFAFSVLALVG